jgi:hypothetical protein
MNLPKGCAAFSVSASNLLATPQFISSGPVKFAWIFTKLTLFANCVRTQVCGQRLDMYMPLP